MTNWTELKRLAEEAGGIEWHADVAVANDGAESRAIYHRPKPYHVVEIIETPDSALDNADCIHSESVWQYIAAANPKTILALIADNERLNKELSACTESPGGCGYWREATRHRESERDQLRAEVEALMNSLRQISNEVDCNMRPLIRDLVNRACGLDNGANPNDLYVDCDRIDEIIDSALDSNQ